MSVHDSAALGGIHFGRAWARRIVFLVNRNAIVPEIYVLSQLFLGTRSDFAFVIRIAPTRISSVRTGPVRVLCKQMSSWRWNVAGRRRLGRNKTKPTRRLVVEFFFQIFLRKVLCVRATFTGGFCFLAAFLHRIKWQAIRWSFSIWPNWKNKINFRSMSSGGENQFEHDQTSPLQLGPIRASSPISTPCHWIWREANFLFDFIMTGSINRFRHTNEH